MRDEHRNESLRDSFLLEGAVGRARRIACDVPLIGASYCRQSRCRYGTGGYSVDRWVQSVISHSRELASLSTSSHLHGLVVPRDFSPLRSARDNIARFSHLAEKSSSGRCAPIRPPPPAINAYNISLGHYH